MPSLQPKMNMVIIAMHFIFADCILKYVLGVNYHRTLMRYVSTMGQKEVQLYSSPTKSVLSQLLGNKPEIRSEQVN